jgi:hypothetical protein
MNNLRKFFLGLALVVSVPSAIYAHKPAPTKYKCMIQMTNYVGEGAYIVVSLIDPKGAYEKTLRVMGSDKKWYKDVKEWYKSYAKKPTNISAITGASVSGGDRSITVLEIDNTKLDAGYKIRFETAVEDKEYYVKDLEIPLTKEAISGKTDGTNYIRYVRFSAN